MDSSSKRPRRPSQFLRQLERLERAKRVLKMIEDLRANGEPDAIDKATRQAEREGKRDRT